MEPGPERSIKHLKYPTPVCGLKLIKKATKLKKDEIMAALGWLGREGKIVITMNDEDIVVALA